MDFSSHNPATSNALNLAARYNDVPLVRMLLKKINPNCTDNRGWTCLHEAAYADSYESLVEILKHPLCRPLVVTFEGYTALYLACVRHCSLATIQALLNSAVTIVNFGSTEDYTPLHIACAQGRVELIQMLIQYRAKVDAKDFDGDTPLHIAALEEKPEAIETLIYAGAEPEVFNECGGFTPFHLACGKTCYRSVELLFPFVSDINQATKTGCTPLMLAIRAENRRVIEFLLSAGADPHYKNSEGEMALDIALQIGHTTIFKMIFCITEKDKINKNIILMACKPHYFKKGILKTLLNSELGPEFFDFYEEFHIGLEKVGHLKLKYKTNAVLNSYLNICEYLYETFPGSFEKFFNLFLKRNVSVNAANKDQCPPLVYLHFSLHYPCCEQVFNILAEHGCNIDYCSADDCTDQNLCIPDAFLASLSSHTLTLPMMIPYSLRCDPDRLLIFANNCGFLKRIQLPAKSQMMALIDPSFKDLDAERLQYHVSPLKHLCRLQIRTAMRSSGLINSTSEFFNALNDLPLPPVVKNYLRYT